MSQTVTTLSVTIVQKVKKNPRIDIVALERRNFDPFFAFCLAGIHRRILVAQITRTPDATNVHHTVSYYRPNGKN